MNNTKHKEDFFDCCQWIGDINDNNLDNGKWCDGKVKRISDAIWMCDTCKTIFSDNTIKMVYED